MGKKQNWIEQFDEEFGCGGNREEQVGKHSNYSYKSFMDFIHSLLSSERQRLREEIERMSFTDSFRNADPEIYFRIKESWGKNAGKVYGKALSDILKLLDNPSA